MLSSIVEFVSNHAGLIVSFGVGVFSSILIQKMLRDDKENVKEPVIKDQYEMFDNVTLNHIVSEVPPDRAVYLKAYIAEVRRRYGMNGFKVGHLGFYYDHYEELDSSDFSSCEIPAFKPEG